MSTYDLGDVVSLTYNTYNSSGTLADATAVSLTITLPDGTTSSPAVTKTATGTYSAAYATAAAGRFTYRWVATGTNASAYADTFDVRDPAYLPIVSLEAAKAHLNITATTSDDELRSILDAATDACEKYANRAFSRRSVTEVHTATGGTRLLLRTPTASAVTSVVEGTTTLAATDYALDPLGVTLRRVSGGVEVKWLTGVDKITVSYVAGYSSPPASVRQGVLEMTRHLWQTQRGAMGARAQFSGDDYAAGLGWSMPRRVAELLDLVRIPSA